MYACMNVYMYSLIDPRIPLQYRGISLLLLEWCQKWSMRVNVSKTKVVHYRTKTQPRSQCTFIFDNVNIDTVDKYKYLGIILDEHLDFNNTAAVLAG